MIEPKKKTWVDVYERVIGEVLLKSRENSFVFVDFVKWNLYLIWIWGSFSQRQKGYTMLTQL